MDRTFKRGRTTTETASIYFMKLHKPTTGWQPYCGTDIDSEYTGTAIMTSHLILTSALLHHYH